MLVAVPNEEAPMKNAHTYILAACLALVGVVIFAYKYIALGLPLTPNESIPTWQIETRIAFLGTMAPVKVTLPFPSQTGRYAVIDQNFVARNYGLFTEVSGDNRRAVFASREAIGEQVLYSRFTVNRVPRASALTAVPSEPLVPKSTLNEPQRLAARHLLDLARSKSTDIPTLALSVLKELRNAGRDAHVDLLLNRQSAPVDMAKAAVEIIKLAGIPARIVNGVQLTESAQNVIFRHWIEVYSDGKWQPLSFQPEKLGIPEDFMPWWRGDEAFVQASTVMPLRSTTTVTPVIESPGWLSLAPVAFMNEKLIEFSLLTLPLDVQKMYRVLLTVPLGVVLLVFLRNVVGISTFGTFMPVLIAMAFRQTSLVWGVFLFTLVVSAGLLVRVYLEYLKLLVVPRLASVLIVVILLMVLFSILMHKIGLSRGLSVALFPFVILTMTIERMSIIWDENGPAAALRQGLGSLATATACYFVMNIEYVQHLLFVYPEILLVLLAVTILLGRYSGYRLTELWRSRTGMTF